MRKIFNVRGNTVEKEGHRNHAVPDTFRNALTVILGEFCGTFMFLLLSFIGAQTAIITNDPERPDRPLIAFSLMYISASFGCALAVNVWIFYRVTGGMFNPAVSPLVLIKFRHAEELVLTVVVRLPLVFSSLVPSSLFEPQ